LHNCIVDDTYPTKHQDYYCVLQTIFLDHYAFVKSRIIFMYGPNTNL